MVYFEQGALSLAAACYRRVVQEAREVGDREDLIPALTGLAQLLYEWNDLENAEQAAQEAWDMSEQVGNQEWLMRSMFVLIKIWFLRGQKLLVHQRLVSLLMQCSARLDLFAEVQLCQMHYWLVEGDATTVQHHLNALSVPEGSVYKHLLERKKVLQIRVFLEQQKYRQAFEELERLQDAAQKRERGRMLMEIQLLMVRLHLAEKQVQDARQILSNILLFAHTEGYLRSFIDEGKGIAALLRMMRPPREEVPLLRYLQTILQAFGPDQETSRRVMTGLDPLSQQEQRVLRLIVAELSYPDIARELIVSVNTVKTQVNNIYRKLNVHSRREARAVVADLRLFSSES
jgi:LuxR family maltose regulon positive regulatory protein